MKITKEQIRKIIREEISGSPQADLTDSATLADLKNWFLSKKDSARDLGVPPAQIRALILYMEDGIEAARAGKLRQASKRLSGIVDKISGDQGA